MLSKPYETLSTITQGLIRPWTLWFWQKLGGWPTKKCELERCWKFLLFAQEMYVSAWVSLLRTTFWYSLKTLRTIATSKYFFEFLLWLLFSYIMNNNHPNSYKWIYSTVSADCRTYFQYYNYHLKMHIFV